VLLAETTVHISEGSSSVGITMLKAHVCITGMCLSTFLSLCDHLQVLDVVRAAELLVNKPSSPTEMLVPKSPGGPKTDLKTTTIVMSKHTLAPQTSTVSTQHFMQYCLTWLFICKFAFAAPSRIPLQ